MAARLMTPRDHMRGHPATPDAYLAIVAAVAKRSGRLVVEDSRTLEPHAENGMWLAWCPNCGNGIAIHPEWPVAGCRGLGCFRIFRAIAMPPEWRAIEAVLMARPMMLRHWLSEAYRTKVQGRGVIRVPAETLEDLRRENRELGLPEAA